MNLLPFSRSLLPQLWLVSVLCSVSASAAPKAKPKPPEPLPPKARVVKNALVAEEEAAPIPATGPLNLAQLIDAALFTHPKTLEARRKSDVARAQRKAATDLKDPELRLFYSTQTDVEVGDPYTIRSNSESNISGVEDDSLSRIGMGTYLGNNISQTQHTLFHETRYGYAERVVTPGATRDKIVETQYEQRTTDSSGSRTRTQPLRSGVLTIRPDGTTETKNLHQTTKTTTYVDHRDTTQANSQMGALLRFSLPNPWEMKAKVAEAEAEIVAADYNSKALENEIVMEARGLYEDLAYTEALKAGLNGLAKQRQAWTDYARTGALDKIGSAAGSVSDTRGALLEATLKAASLRSQLAQLAGIADPARISVPPDFRHRVINVSALNEAYLIQMASVFRADLHFLMAKNDSARAAYRKERAARVPFATSVDFGAAVHDDYRGQNSTDFTARINISLPLWSWLLNDADKVPAAAAQGYSREISRLNANLATQVKTALEMIHLAQQALDESEKEFAALQTLMKSEALGGAGLSKNPQEVILGTDEILLKIKVERLKLHRSYNQAVLGLEQALGTRLEKILAPSGK